MWRWLTRDPGQDLKSPAPEYTHMVMEHTGTVRYKCTVLLSSGAAKGEGQQTQAPQSAASLIVAPMRGVQCGTLDFVPEVVRHHFCQIKKHASTHA